MVLSEPRAPLEQVEDLCDGCSPSFLSLRSPGCRREVRQRLAQMAAMPVGRAVGLPLRAGGRGSLWVGPVPAAELPAQRRCSPGLLVCPCRFFVQMGRMAAAELRCAQTRGCRGKRPCPRPDCCQGPVGPRGTLWFLRAPSQATRQRLHFSLVSELWSRAAARRVLLALGQAQQRRGRGLRAAPAQGAAGVCLKTSWPLVPNGGSLLLETRAASSPEGLPVS